MSVKPKVRRRLTVTGQVQGVGFRPFVYRLAAAERLAGFVNNSTAGVTIEVQGPPDAIDRLAARLRSELPPLASISSLKQEDVPVEKDAREFVISPSRGGEMADAQVTVDSVVCADCLRELFDPGDRRYLYPFINCTNCGPRYTMVTGIPYDRPKTTMAAFEMCRDCRREYTDPGDRRYHAQPVACAACGPRVWLADTSGKGRNVDDPIAAAAQLLLKGRIVAVKGLGGFQLAVRADDESAVARLRLRKHRQAKPFALMVKDLAAARRILELDETAERELSSPRGAIVLVTRRVRADIAPSVASGTDLLGAMLPTTPVHHLLFAHDLPPLVMTSGNLAEEPLVKDNDEAAARLGGIADALLVHDRPIERRLDDSVVISMGGGRVVPIRRARGYAPVPLKMAIGSSPPILAVGGELKNTFCFYRDGRALVSEHIGDLDNAATYEHFIGTVSHLAKLYDFAPELIAADLHPGYLSTRYAERRSAGEIEGHPAAPLVHVQHHHAHIAAVMAEHGRSDPVIGIAADGTGYGTDGNIWGCEILLASFESFERLGHLQYFDLPGGDAAARETWRPTLSLLRDAFDDAIPPEVLRLLGIEPARVGAVLDMLRTRTRCVATSSLGRLFDAAAAVCGLATENRFEGEAPMALEMIAREENAYPFALSEERPFTIDVRPIIGKIAEERLSGVGVNVISGRFHRTVCECLAAAAQLARERTGIHVVALSGGCFVNRRLNRCLADLLASKGFTVLQHRDFPVGDGCISLGQAMVAAGRRL